MRPGTAKRLDAIIDAALTRQCVAGRHIGDIKTLREETAAWSTDVNAAQRGVDWQMKTEDARCKLKSVYPRIKVLQSTVYGVPNGTAVSDRECKRAVQEPESYCLTTAVDCYITSTTEHARASLGNGTLRAAGPLRQ